MDQSYCSCNIGWRLIKGYVEEEAGLRRLICSSSSQEVAPGVNYPALLSCCWLRGSAEKNLKNRAKFGHEPSFSSKPLDGGPEHISMANVHNIQ